jgi:acyl-lipid omega-6 desaturase (Delta-12 desaturase)
VLTYSPRLIWGAVLKHQETPLTATPSTTPARPAREWLQILATYKEPSLRRSIFEIAVTAVPFVVLWGLAVAALSVSYLLSLAIEIVAAAFVVRLFMIQHDCGHGAFFRRRGTNDWIGRILGVVTLTPYDVWRQSHATHHATSGDLDARGIGDVATLTVREYQALSWNRRLQYRLYRHPLVMFGLGPAYLFLLQNRLPARPVKASTREWISAMATNAAIAVLFTGLIYAVGVVPFILVHLPIILMASTIGVWLFFVQHQFEDTFWAVKPDWTHHDAALYGSSHYDLPLVLRWLTANIGIHHVHHLYSRIPYYRLNRVMRDHPELANIRRLTLWQSFAQVPLCLWDEQANKLISFGDLRRSTALA